MSLILQLSTKVNAADALAKMADEGQQSRGEFEGEAFRRALILIEPATTAEAAEHARAIDRLIGGLPFEPVSFARQLVLVPGAVKAIVAALEAAQENEPTDVRQASVIECAAAELQATWQEQSTDPISRRLLPRGDALERVILTVPPANLVETAIVADVVLRWVRDICPPAGVDVSDDLEAIERGLDLLVAALHSLSGRPTPSDRRSFGQMLLAPRH